MTRIGISLNPDNFWFSFNQSTDCFEASRCVTSAPALNAKRLAIPVYPNKLKNFIFLF